MRLFSTSLFSTSVMISIILVGGTTAANAQYSGTGTGSGSGSGYSATQMQQAVMAAEYATIAYLNTPNQANLTTAQARVDALIPYNSTRSTVDSSLGVYSYAQKKLSATILYSRAKIVINVHRDTPSNANLTLANQAVALLVPYNNIPSDISGYNLHSAAQRNLEGVSKYVLAKTAITAYSAARNQSNLTIAQNAVAAVQPFNNFPSGQNTLGLYSAAKQSLDQAVAALIPSITLTSPRGGENISNSGNANEAFLMTFNVVNRAQIPSTAVMTMSLEAQAGGTSGVLGTLSAFGLTTALNNGQVRMNFDIVEGSPTARPVVPGPGYKLHVKIYTNSTKTQLLSSSLSNAFTIVNSPHIEQGLRLYNDAINGANNYNAAINPQADFYNAVVALIELVKPYNDIPDGNRGLYDAAREHFGGIVYNKAIQLANSYDAAINPQADFYNGVVALIELVKPYNDIKDGDKGLYDAAREHFGGIVYNKAIQLANSYDAAINPQADFYNGVVALIELVKPYNDIKDGDKGLYDAAREHFGGIVYNKAIQLANSYDAAINPQSDFYNGVVALIELVKPYNDIKDGDKGLYDAAREHFGGIVYNKAIQLANSYDAAINPQADFYNGVVALIELVKPYNDIKDGDKGLYDAAREHFGGIVYNKAIQLANSYDAAINPQADFYNGVVALIELVKPYNDIKDGDKGLYDAAREHFGGIVYNKAIQLANSYDAAINPQADFYNGVVALIELVKPYNNIKDGDKGLYDAAREHFGGIVYTKAIEAINNYKNSVNPTQEFYDFVVAQVELVRPFNDIKLANNIGLYDDLRQRLTGIQPPQASVGLVLTSPAGGESISNSANYNYSYPVTFNVVNKNSVPATAIMTMSLEGGSTSGVLGALNSGGLTNALNEGRVKINFNLVEGSPSARLVIPGSGYRLRIRLYADANGTRLLAESVSNAFTIVAAPSISITSPQGGESISNSGNSTDAFPVTFNVVNKNSVPATAIMTLSLEGGSTSGVLGGLNSGGLTNALNAGQVKINFNIVERSPGVVPVVPGAGYRLHIRLYADPYTNQLLSESLSNSFTIVSVSLVQEAKNAIDHFFTIRSQYGAGSPEDTAAMNAMNAAMQAVDSAHQTEVTTYYNYKKALYIIAQYIKTPNQENLNYALAIIEYLKPLNSIQVSATNKLGLYDDAITRLIQAVKNNVVQTNKISPIAGSYVVAVDNGRVFVTMDTGVINQYQWDPITKTQKLTLTINPPSGVNCAQSFGHPISVKGNTLVAYGLCRNAFITEQATARLYIYKFNAQTNQWNQQKSINQKRITGSADLRDYLDLQSLINSPTEIGINWAFSQVDVPNHPGDVSESILFTILSSGTFYGKAFVLDHQLAYNSLNSINPNSAQTVWTTSSAPGILTGDKAINVDADGNYAIINTTASLLPKFAVLSSTLNQRTVSGEVVYFKSWQEELVPALNNTKMTLASLAINEEAYPQAPIGVGAGVPGKVTIAIGSQYESEVQTTGIITGKIFTLSGMINPVTKAITWDALKPLAVVMPYTTNQQAGFTLSLKNKTLVVGTSATQILGNSTRLAQLPSLAANLTDLPSNPVANPGMVMVYKFDSTQNQWLWNYNVYKNRLNDSTSFGISLGTDGSTVAAATIGFSGSSSNEVTVVNPS